MHGEDDASQGDVEMGFDLPFVFDGDDSDGRHEIDGERSSSSHPHGQARDAFVQPRITKEYHPSINGMFVVLSFKIGNIY